MGWGGELEFHWEGWSKGAGKVLFLIWVEMTQGYFYCNSFSFTVFPLYVIYELSCVLYFTIIKVSFVSLMKFAATTPEKTEKAT